MKLEDVIGIVKRDRALEMLLSRQRVLRRAADLYLVASRSFYPSPAAHSTEAFENFVLQVLASRGSHAAQQECLCLLLRIIQATAFEHLTAINQKRAAYASDLARIAADVLSQRGYPLVPAIDQATLAIAISFELARNAIEQAPPADSAMWGEADVLISRIRQLQRLRELMESAARYVRRRARRERTRRIARVLSGVAIGAAAIAVITFAQILMS